jgi:hypothetical protein
VGELDICECCVFFVEREVGAVLRGAGEEGIVFGCLREGCVCVFGAVGVSVPSGILVNGVRIHQRSKPSLTIASLDQNAFRLDWDNGGYGGIEGSLLEGSTNQVFVHSTPGYNP